MAGIVLAGGGVERDHARPAGVDREPGDHELAAVLHHHRNPIARLEAACQVTGEGLDSSQQALAADDNAVLKDERRLVGLALTGLANKRDDVPR